MILASLQNVHEIMNIWWVLLILLGVAMLACAIGFKKFVWFLSIGYGFAVLACGVAIAIIYGVQGALNITGLIACILFVVYGFRLGGFLALREFKNATYRKTLEEATKTEKKIPMGVLIFMWILCAILYVAQTSSVAFVLQMRATEIQYYGFMSVNPLEIVGVSIMALGILIEAIADYQKSAQKKVNPNMVATKGLYRICRCPNYYGEILNWTGVFVYFFAIVSMTVAAPTVTDPLRTVSIWASNWWMWIFIVLAYICIVYIMFNGAKRLEGRQASRYGEMEEFKVYTAKTPIIIYLFIPIKSLLNSKIVK